MGKNRFGKNQDGVEKEVFVYMMNAPHKDVQAKPSKFYLDGNSGRM